MITRHERSSDLQATGRAMAGQVAELMSVSDDEFRTPSYLNMVILALRDQYSFMLTTLIRLAEDVLHWCPALKVGRVSVLCGNLKAVGLCDRKPLTFILDYMPLRMCI